MAYTKTAGALMLACAAGTAQCADWVRVGQAGKGADRHYVDKSSFVRTGKTVKAWSLTSLAQARRLDDGAAYLAVKALHQYACEERTATLKAQVYYADAMGRTAPLQNIKYERFTPEEVVPDSVQDHTLALACPKADETPPAAPPQAGKSGK